MTGFASIMALALAAQPGAAQPASNTTAPVPVFADPLNPGARFPEVSVSPDGTIIYVIGPLYQDAYFRFAQALREAPKVKTVFLGSGGGLLIEGHLIGNMVRKRKLDTYVGHYCASACTQVFAAGKSRTAAPMAQIGFHRSFAVDTSGKMIGEDDRPAAEKADPDKTPSSILWLSGNDAMRASYDRTGVAQEFIRKIIATPSAGMWHPAHAEMLEAGFLTRDDNVSELPPAPNYGLSRDAVIAKMTAAPFWAGLQRAEPALFADQANTVWRRVNTGTAHDEIVTIARFEAGDRLIARIALASDALLDRFAVVDGAIAAEHRANDYTPCKPASIVYAAPSAQMMAVVAQEDTLFTELFAEPVPQKPLAAERAERDLGKLARDIRISGLVDAYEPDDSAAKCRVGYQYIEAIGQLEPKKRVKAFRAIVSLTAAEQAKPPAPAAPPHLVK
jgi:hypothetical protein